MHWLSVGATTCEKHSRRCRCDSAGGPSSACQGIPPPTCAPRKVNLSLHVRGATTLLDRVVKIVAAQNEIGQCRPMADPSGGEVHGAATSHYTTLRLQDPMGTTHSMFMPSRVARACHSCWRAAGSTSGDRSASQKHMCDVMRAVMHNNHTMSVR